MRTRLVLGIALLAAAGGAAAQGALRHDPFRAPPPPAPVPVAAAEPSAPPPPAPVAVWRATLRAVLVDGERSLANVDGILVRLGREVDGFRLVEVSEGRAVFVRDGRRFTLSMHGEGERP